MIKEVENTRSEMKIFNGTEHTINFFQESDCAPVQNGRKLVVKEGAVPSLIIEAGTNLNAAKGNKPAPKLDISAPIVGAVIFTKIDPLPDGYDLYIVSNLYRSATVELGLSTEKLATVDGTVYEDEKAIRPCGCLRLAVG